MNNGAGSKTTHKRNPSSGKQRPQQTVGNKYHKHSDEATAPPKNRKRNPNIVTENLANDTSLNTGGVDTEAEDSFADEQASRSKIRYELGFKGIKGLQNKSKMQQENNQDANSYDQQSYDDELDYERNEFSLNYQPYDQPVDNKFLQQQQVLFNAAIHEKIMKERQAVIVGAPYYEKRCQNHLTNDDPNDHNCTFRPQLFRPLGAPKEAEGIVDPLMFKPVKTIKHSPITKSSMDYHYKRLNQARTGPKIYKSKPAV